MFLSLWSVYVSSRERTTYQHSERGGYVWLSRPCDEPGHAGDWMLNRRAYLNDGSVIEWGEGGRVVVDV